LLFPADRIIRYSSFFWGESLKALNGVMMLILELNASSVRRPGSK